MSQPPRMYSVLAFCLAVTCCVFPIALGYVVFHPPLIYLSLFAVIMLAVIGSASVTGYSEWSTQTYRAPTPGFEDDWLLLGALVLQLATTLTSVYCALVLSARGFRLLSLFVAGVFLVLLFLTAMLMGAPDRRAGVPVPIETRARQKRLRRWIAITVVMANVLAISTATIGEQRTAFASFAVLGVVCLLASTWMSFQRPR